MFFKLVSRNSRRSRKENGLFFASLLISIVAFYVILSLSHQDVMLFVAKMESHAVDKLLGMIPVFYVATLFILFFLIYYAGRFQMERRRHEFGVYLMMGMRRKRLFLMLMAEDFRSSLLALAIGIPAAVLLSELVSLVTARLVGLDIVGHQFTFSPGAVLWTAVGFLLVKLAAFLLLSGRIAGQQIGALLTDAPVGAKRQLPQAVYGFGMAAGLACVGTACALATDGIVWTDVAYMGLMLILGIAGMILLFFGLGAGIGFLAKRGKKDRRLQVFHFRQLQEIITGRPSILAVSALLILASLCCFGTGVGIAAFYGSPEQHVLDYTLGGYKQDADSVRQALKDSGMESRFSELFAVKTDHVHTTEEYEGVFQMDEVISALEEMPEKSKMQQALLNNLSYADYPYLISLDGYNRILSLAGEPELELGEGELGVYMDYTGTTNGRKEIMDRILADRPQVWLDGRAFHLAGTVQAQDLVLDGFVSYSFALILPEELFDYYTQGKYETYLNGVLDREFVGEKSLMGAVMEMNEELDELGIAYESYLEKQGRNLFFMVAASYITVYLAIIFLIVANTMMEVQFLMGQRKSGRRYRTLVRLGATQDMLCQSAARQIDWYFGLPTAVAVGCSFFGVRSMLVSGMLSQGTQGNAGDMMWISVAMIFLLVVVEFIYITAVKKASSRYFLTLMVPEREE